MTNSIVRFLVIHIYIYSLNNDQHYFGVPYYTYVYIAYVMTNNDFFFFFWGGVLIIYGYIA